MTIDLYELKTKDIIKFANQCDAEVIKVEKTDCESTSLSHRVYFKMLHSGYESCNTYTSDGHHWSSKSPHEMDIVKITPYKKSARSVDLSTLTVGDCVVMDEGSTRQVLRVDFNPNHSTPYELKLLKINGETNTLSFTRSGYFFSNMREECLNINEVIKSALTKFNTKLTEEEVNLIITGLSQLLVDRKVKADQVRIMISKLLGD